MLSKKTPMQLHTVGLVHIAHQQVLLAFSANKQCFYLPGGKIDKNETAVQALCREIEEELQVSLTADDLVYYTHISAPAFGEAAGITMEQECYLIKKDIHPLASAEIEELRYFSLASYLQMPRTAPGVVLLLQLLTAEGKIAQ